MAFNQNGVCFPSFVDSKRKDKTEKHLLYHHGNLRRIILGWKLDTDTAEEKSKFFSKFLRRKNILQHQSGKKNKNE
jgi:hypothetical protein